MLLDYELIGDLQVSNGIVSGFNNSTNNYIKIPYSLPMGSNKVEICISVYIPAFTSGSVILANYNDASSGGGLGLRTDATYNDIYYWTWDSSGTLIADRIDLGFDLTIGTNIIKFVYENSTITWYKSTDGTSFTQGVSRSGTIADFRNYLAIGASGTVWSSGNMQVNMLDSYIKLNDEYWHSKEYIKQKTRIIQRHDTAANWSTINPVLALGEMGVETDTNKFKFGDGTTSYNELPYAAGEGGSGSGTLLTSNDGTISYNKLALGDSLLVNDTPVKELNGVTQTNGTLNSELEFTGGSGAYLKMNEQYDLATANSWEFQIKYKHNGGGSYPTIFGYANGLDYKTPAFILEGGSLKLFLSSDGNSWNLNQANSDLAPVVGTIYYFKVGFTGSQYYIKYNTTGWSDEFTTQWTLSSTTKVYCSDYFMLMNLSLNNNYYNTGTMYLQDTRLIINEEEVWRGVNITPGPITLNVNSEKINKQDKLTAGDGIEIFQRDTNVIPPSIALPYTFTNEGTTVFTSNQMLDDGAAIHFKVSQESIGSFIGIKESVENSGVAFQVRNNRIYSNLWVNDSIGEIASSSEISITQGIYYKVKYHNDRLLELFYSLDGITYIAIGTWHGYGSKFYNKDINMLVNSGYQGGGDCTVTKLELVGSTNSSVLTIQTKPATITSIGAVQPDGNTITASNSGVISVVPNSIAGYSFPSNRYTDLSLGASGSTYTAPANGYFQLGVLNGTSIQFYNKTKADFWKASTSAGGAFSETIGCQAGDIIQCYYDYTTFNRFRFYYAEGSKE